MFIYFLARYYIHNVLYSVTTYRYIICNGMEKKVQAYFVQFYLHRNIMHVVHVRG